MTTTDLDRQYARMIALGFDETYDTDDGLRVKCSQCEALVINGTPCHEHGCPHEMHECHGCNALVPRGVKYCDDCR